MSVVADISPREAVMLGATDPIFYARYFFPKACRQVTPLFHKETWALLESPEWERVSIEMFRGAAKTTLTRLYLSRQIAYGWTNVGLVVGKSEEKASSTIDWIMRAVKYNKVWAEAFGLSPGKPWTITDTRVRNNILGKDSRFLAYGITGSIRGVNIDDWRPDLIIGDDLIAEDTAGSKMQQEKTEDLWFGALYNSLAPRSEADGAKQILLGTPLAQNDVNEICRQDPAWGSVRFGVFNENGESRWPERWSTAELLKEKAQYLARNQLSIWLREKECLITAPENSALPWSRVNFWDAPLPASRNIVLVIDPVPPPSEVETAKDMRNKDFECLLVAMEFRGSFYILDYEMNRGHDPTWTAATFVRMAQFWKPRLVVVETVAYQATLKWLLEQVMRKERLYLPIEGTKDKRSKFDRIVDGLSGPLSMGQVYISRTHTELAEQGSMYPKVDHDDVIECAAVAIAKLNGPMFSLAYEEDESAIDATEELEPLTLTWASAP